MSVKTKVIKINSEIKDDLTYIKYYKSEDLSYELRETPELFDVEKEYNDLRNQDISQSVDGKIISISSVMKPNEHDFCCHEEITITYEESK